MGVYFVHDDASNVVKIGTSTRVKLRFGSIRSSNIRAVLLAIIPGDRETELEWHKRYAADRIEGEWFTATDELMAEIRSLESISGAPESERFSLSVRFSEEAKLALRKAAKAHMRSWARQAEQYALEGLRREGYLEPDSPPDPAP